MGQMIWPLPGYSRILSPFGPRKQVKTTYGLSSPYHNGIDVPAPTGTQIIAARGGTVTQVRTTKMRGKFCIINHGNGIATLYQHCSSIGVKMGQEVQAGQAIAKVGATGNVSGPHLHFEVHVNGKEDDPTKYVSYRDTAAKYTGGPIASSGTDGFSASTTESSQDVQVIHIPQTSKEYTVYADDTPYKNPDRYKIVWQALGNNGRTRDITDRCGSPTLTDDSESVAVEFTFSVLQARGEKFFPPLRIQCGDLVSVSNLASGECIFLGQVQSVSGSYSESMSIVCHDAGRLLTTNDVIMQFNNIPAKDALSQLANKVGIQRISCPNLISSVYGTEKDTTSNIIQKILETVTSENGVTYFPRMMGNTLVIRSYAQKCITAWYRQESNLAAFDVMKEIASPQVSWDISDLRNHITVYSEQDDTVSIQGVASSEASIKRYGKRTALETFSDSDTVSATAKAKNLLGKKNRTKETFSCRVYGSDKVVAGCRMKVNIPDEVGEFWVTAVSHELAPIHMMTLTMERCDQ
nr:MAG TPA: 43 kDa tail protein [Caudoviricetes sp.]